MRPDAVCRRYACPSLNSPHLIVGRHLNLWAESVVAGIFSNGLSGTMRPRMSMSYDSKRKFIGRLDLDRLVGLEGWMPDRKLNQVIEDLTEEGRL